MDTFKKFIATICAILFVISGIIALFAFNIERKAFTSATYKQAFENQNLYERMPEIMANALHATIAEDVNADPYLKPLTAEDWRTTFIALLSPEDLKTLTDNALDSVFAYLNGNADSVVVSLAPIKEQLAGDAGFNVVAQILRAQPACTVEQLMQIGFGLLDGDVILCNPPEELLGLMTPVIESQLQVLALTFPDEVTLVSGAQSNTLASLRIKLDKARTLMNITPVLPLFFLFVLTLFAVRRLVDWLKWWGWPFLIVGAISSLTAWIGAPAFGLIVQRVLQNQGSGFMPPILFSTMQETISAVTSQILKPVAIEGLVLAILGLGMVIIAAIIVKRGKRV